MISRVQGRIRPSTVFAGQFRARTMYAWTALIASIIVGIEAPAADDSRDSQLASYMIEAAKLLKPEQAEALRQIRDEDKRHLALVYYLRAGATIGARWSWTADRIRNYGQSIEFKETLAEIEKISARFAAENPGYALYTNIQVRSLEEQVERWQRVGSIAVAASELRSAALTQLSNQAYARTPSDTSVDRFRSFLIAWRASSPPTLAAPGLSLHGRGRAYDFQIRDKTGRTVAGPDTATIPRIWDSRGWTEKLSRAVHGASDKFVGPLAAPREPWHYEYRPEQ